MTLLLQFSGIGDTLQTAENYKWRQMNTAIIPCLRIQGWFSKSLTWALATHTAAEQSGGPVLEAICVPARRVTCTAL